MLTHLIDFVYFAWLSSTLVSPFLLLLCFHVRFLVGYEVVFVVAPGILEPFRSVFAVGAFARRFLSLPLALLLRCERRGR